MKSGTDFQNVSEIVVERLPVEQIEQLAESPHLIYHEQVETGKPYSYRLRDDLLITIIKHDVTTDIEPNAEVRKHIEEYDQKLQEKMKTVPAPHPGPLQNPLSNPAQVQFCEDE